MVFGRTYKEQIEREALRVTRAEGWHKFFPLFPRQVDDGRWVWMQSCERRVILGHDDVIWIYRLAPEGKVAG